MHAIRRLTAYTAAGAMGITGVCAAAGPAVAATTTGITLTSISFEQSTVDATSGSATVTLDWTVADANAAATNVTGALTLQQVSATGQPVGPDLSLSYAYMTYADVNASSGTAQSSTYSYAFTVPQYAATPSATWAVVNLTAADDQSGSLTVGRNKLAATSGTSFTADELVDDVGASYGGVSVTSAIPAYAQAGYLPAYFNDAAGPVGLTYSIEAIDPDSGFSQGVMVLRGPGGQTIGAKFGVQFDALGATTCGPDTSNWGSTDIECDIPVTLPQGTAAGTWVVSKLKLTDAAGTETDYGKLSLAPVVLTQNAVLQAENLTLSPSTADNWISPQHLALSFTPEHAQGGIASVTLTTDSGCFGGDETDNPTVAADGSITLPVLMSAGPVTKKCTVTGVAVFDGAGDLAAYGPAFDDPTALVTTQTPDTTAPVATAAALDQQTIAQSALPTTITVTASVTSMAGVQEIIAGVYDANGNWVNAGEGNYNPGVTDGTVKTPIPLPAGLAPGTYTVGFTLLDFGNLDTHYGYPPSLGLGSSTPPNGLLQFTVTS